MTRYKKIQGIRVKCASGKVSSNDSVTGGMDWRISPQHALQGRVWGFRGSYQKARRL